MQIALYICYLLLFSFLVAVIPFFKRSGIGTGSLLALFYVKISAGIAYAKFYTLPRYYQNSDTWRFYRLSLQESEWLRNNPAGFLKDLFVSGYNTRGNLFSGENTYWNDLKSNVIVKLIASFNIVTNNDYYIDLIFFNFLFLFGLVAIVRMLLDAFPAKKIPIIIVTFLWPSTLFWCSGIHKDGLILSAMGLFLYGCYICVEKEFSLKFLLLIIFSATVMFSLRNYLLFALVPAIACWIAARYLNRNSTVVFLTIYLSAAAFIFIIPAFFTAVDVPSFIVEKRQEFLKLTAGSFVNSPPLHPTVTGFLSYLPHAVDMAFLRPYFWELKNPSCLPAIADNLILFTSIAISIYKFRRGTTIFPFIIAPLTFSISVLLICGYTIPFAGAVTRYKSVVLPLLIAPLICLSNISFKTLQPDNRPGKIPT